MDSKKFDELCDLQFAICKHFLKAEAEEYALEDDRLHVFEIASDLTGKPPRQALGGMMVKHTVSIYDMIQAEELVDMALWDEKITDSINYLLLLKAVVLEEAEIKTTVQGLMQEQKLQELREKLMYPTTTKNNGE